jgi:hypothetical protein
MDIRHSEDSFNDMVCPKGRSLPLGVNLAPGGEFFPLRGTFTPPPGVTTLKCLEEWSGKQKISPPVDNFTPRGQNSPLGVKVCPWGLS